MINLDEKQYLHLKMYLLLMFINKHYRPVALLCLRQTMRVFGSGSKIYSTIYVGCCEKNSRVEFVVNRHDSMSIFNQLTEKL